jgi:hypothetical protein
MTDLNRDDDVLNTLFHELKQQTTVIPSDDLMARILADAAEMQPNPHALMASDTLPRRPLWQAVFAAIGGWPAVSGLATAGIAGIWIGVSGLPDSVAGNFTALLSGPEVYLYELEDGLSGGSSFEIEEG